MKKVLIFGATLIRGAVRYPIEGPLTVSDADAERIVENKQGEIVEEEDDEDEVGSALNKLTVPQLRELAVHEEVELGEATKKADLIGLIEKHRAEKAARNAE